MKRSQLNSMIVEVVRAEIRKYVQTELRETIKKQIKIHTPILVKESMEELLPDFQSARATEPLLENAGPAEDWRSISKSPLTTSDLESIRMKIREEMGTPDYSSNQSFKFDQPELQNVQIPPELNQVFTKDYRKLLSKAKSRGT